MLSAAIAFGFLNTVAFSHLCVMQPPQRVGAGEIATPGEHVCYLKEGPCGGVPSGEPMATLTGGQEFTIHFQQNLNHFYKEDPGSLVADFAEAADPTEEQFTPLGKPIADYNAMNEITQTNFTLSVTVPNVDCPHCVLRMRYKSNNPSENDRGMIFYQCADVAVTKSATGAVGSSAIGSEAELKVVPAPVAAVTAEDYSCCAPSVFSMQGYETGSWRLPTHKSYYFDAPNQFFRVDSVSGDGKGETTKDGSFQMYSNFTSGIEYYYNAVTGSCDLYGLNYWSDWCYGTANSQHYVSSITIGTSVADVWGMSTGDSASPFTWTNQREGCVPIGMNRADTGETTSFYNAKKGAFCPSRYEMPQACTDEARRLTEVAAQQGKQLRETLPPTPHELERHAPARL